MTKKAKPLRRYKYLGGKNYGFLYEGDRFLS